jgi:tellurite resistance protein
MTGTVQSPYTTEQTVAWLRGLLTLAWSDGHFDEEEKDLITELTRDELAPDVDLGDLETITPDELAAAFGENSVAAENFLRTAVMVALADGVYSPAEDKLLHEFCDALGQQIHALEALRHTLEDCIGEEIPDQPSDRPSDAAASPISPPQSDEHEDDHPSIDVLRPTKEWLDNLDIRDPKVARFLCKMVPSQCPFERDIKLFGHKLVHIPPMCKLNPLYEQLVNLRFRALSYLADECGEDVSQYL